ncbi:SGNH/GDSL hydrolase family protein [Algirhabdus cladophorae]|uniref:SGNH/GDSL hydrolase family protein n=1 Tax=Algirhabdus cladophorae TaxID=3377108 RepID=UPI003B84A8CB
MKYVAALAVTVFAFLLGLYAGPSVKARFEAVPATTVCRPSSPEKLGDQPAVLFWGNSLAFDGDWPLDGFVSVNCGVQGLTAQAAVELTPSLPDLDFAAVVIIFGTVELIRGAESPEIFRASVNDVLDQLGQKYPKAKFVALGVPRRTATNIWRYENERHLDVVNDILRQMNDVIFIDSTEILEDLTAGSETYDGVHFSRQSYFLLAQKVQKTLDQLD